MTAPAPFLDFFVLEAGEYIEQIDALLLVAGSRGPSEADSETMQRLARALRGSATMAKIGAFADLASGVERTARALKDGSLTWDASIRGVLVAAVDDLKILLRNARHWAPADDERAKARTAELLSYVPAPTSAAAPPSTGGATFLAGEATNIAAGVELLATRPDDRDTAIQVLERVRAVRGIAGVKEVAGLADVLDTTEDAAKGLERGEGRLSAEGEEVLRAAAVLLRCISRELRDGEAGHPAGPERAAFAAAVDVWVEHEVASEPVVPIAALFYPDSGPHVVSAAANPPTSSAERFRLELVNLVEHLRGLLMAAYEETEEPTARARREFLRALRSIASVVHSFGDSESSDLVNGIATEVASGAPLDLARINAVADALDEVGEHADRLRTRLTVEARARPTTQIQRVPTPDASLLAVSQAVTPVAPIAAVAPEGPHAPPAPAPPKRVTTQVPRLTPSQLSRLTPSQSPRLTPSQSPRLTPTKDSARRTSEIDAGVAAIERLEAFPLAEATPMPQSEIVPIDTLLYRGRGALVRAIEIRDECRRAGGGEPPSSESLDELFDLLDLAMAE